jgi:hypothetical protein
VSKAAAARKTQAAGLLAQGCPLGEVVERLVGFHGVSRPAAREALVAALAEAEGDLGVVERHGLAAVLLNRLQHLSRRAEAEGNLTTAVSALKLVAELTKLTG